MKQTAASNLDALFDSGYSAGTVSLHSATSFTSASSIHHVTSPQTSKHRADVHHNDSGLCIDREDSVDGAAVPQPKSPIIECPIRLDPRCFMPDEDGDT
jgi:hypothetical protein